MDSPSSVSFFFSLTWLSSNHVGCWGEESQSLHELTETVSSLGSENLNKQCVAQTRKFDASPELDVVVPHHVEVTG
ncbi:hypothetical protein BDV29DRAFT_184786 [Aspergillus leporis]|uniref:Secreted protein n=1 Tax=Aspergillus leporis TaxID=41062 RepID=A0A5N5WII8_9EURO|nr:hypothetical protein BDV29DRAFT_184786 [Aspergillus leporis]